jgi:putative transposase
MPRLARSSLAAPYFHVVNRTVRRLPIFVRPTDYRAFLKVLEEGLGRYPVRLVAFSLLADQWHLVVGPDGTNALSRFVQWVTATHAIRWRCVHHLRGCGPVYEGRYRSTPLTGAADLVHACRHVERRAVRARLVPRAQDWPWCSLAERLQPSASVPLVAAPFLMSSAWVDYVNTTTLRERIEDARLAPRPSDAGDLSENPGRLAGVAQPREGGISRIPSDHDHQTHSHVERTEHLGVIDPAAVL